MSDKLKSYLEGTHSYLYYRNHRIFPSHVSWRMVTDNGKSLPESGSNSDILPGVRTEELKACESRFDLVRIFTRFSEIILP